jgi:hypothetical protein
LHTSTAEPEPESKPNLRHPLHTSTALSQLTLVN